MDQYFTTPAGYRRFLTRIVEARAEFKTVTDSNEEANGSGDSSVWHDNFAYEQNQRLMHQLARRVRDLEQVLSAMKIVDLPSHPSEVCLGAIVRVVDCNTGREERWAIGGFEDGDPSARRVSYTSPLARALVGAEPGDTRELRCNGATRELEIVAVEPAMEGDV